MKEYQNLEMEIVKLETEDVVTASGGGLDLGEEPIN